MSAGKLAVFGVPSAAGARSSGVSQAPFALRAAGLLERLRDGGWRVVHLSDLSLFPLRDDRRREGALNAAGVACAVAAAADEMQRALAEGFTLVLGGDCSLVAGTLRGAGQALDRPVGLVYLDANADLNTPTTTPSGYLNGQALALALGRGPVEVVGSVAGEHVALLGFRALDPGEREALGGLGLALPALAARRLGMRAAAALALDAVENNLGPILVHLDVDLLDPGLMPAKDVLTPGVGLDWTETEELLARLVASPRVIGLEVCEFNPQKDPDASLARRLVELLSVALARR